MLFASGTVLKPNSTCTYQPRNTIPSARNSPGDPPTSPKGERQNEPKQSRMHYTSAALMATQTLRSTRSTHPLHEYTHTLLHCTHCIHLLLLLLHTQGFCPCLHTIPNAKAQTLVSTHCHIVQPPSRHPQIPAVGNQMDPFLFIPYFAALRWARLTAKSAGLPE